MLNPRQYPSPGGDGNLRRLTELDFVVHFILIMRSPEEPEFNRLQYFVAMRAKSAGGRSKYDLPSSLKAKEAQDLSSFIVRLSNPPFWPYSIQQAILEGHENKIFAAASHSSWH